MSLSSDQQDLMDAVLDDNARKVSALLKKGVDPDFSDEDDNTPLAEAISNGNLSIVKALVNAGADVNRPSSYHDEELPLDLADERAGYYQRTSYYDYDDYGYRATPSHADSSKKIVEFLEQAGAGSSDANRLNMRQRELLDAVQDDDLRKVKTILARGVDPDFVDDGEDGPLTEAIRCGNLSMVKALVNAGADVNRVDSSRQAPLDVARDMGEDAISDYLETEGAVTGRSRSRPAKKAKTMHGRGVSAGFKGGFADAVGAKAGAENAAAPKQPRPVFREDTLKDIFNAKNWEGKTDEMIALWEQVPKRLQKEFDFAAALAEARQGTLRQNANIPRLQLARHSAIVVPPQVLVEAGLAPAPQKADNAPPPVPMHPAVQKKTGRKPRSAAPKPPAH